MLYPTLVPFGWNDRWAALFTSAVDDLPTPTPADRLVPGRVLRHDGPALLVALPDGPRSLPLGRPLEPPPTVGDWLVVVGDNGLLRAVLPRTSLLARRAADADVPQPLAANVDLVLIACGLDRPVKPGRIDRAITLAWDAGATPVVVLTKADLVVGTHGHDGPDEPGDLDGRRNSDGPDGPGDQAHLADLTAEVAAAHPGVDVVATSAATGYGLDELRPRLADRTVVVVGESGAGKSSLTNALVEAEVAAVGRVRRGDAKGRHTTSARQAHRLPGNGLLIDTPGLRAVGLWAEPDAVASTFTDVDELAATCRFADCGHDTEPGCAVRAAVDEGQLPAPRLDAWRRLQREAAAVQRRADPRLRRQHSRHMARQYKEAKLRKARP